MLFHFYRLLAHRHRDLILCLMPAFLGCARGMLLCNAAFAIPCTAVTYIEATHKPSLQLHVLKAFYFVA